MELNEKQEKNGVGKLHTRHNVEALTGGFLDVYIHYPWRSICKCANR